MSFGDHLSTHENVCLSLAKVMQQLTKRLFAPRGVSVHPAHPGFRKKGFYLGLHPLSTKAKWLERGGITLGTQ
jgi:hypothetical protein